MTRILVIEDETPLRIILERLLKLEGYDVVTAENGASGLSLVRETHPHLVVCDLLMPELNGYGVLEALRADPATGGIPLIFLTASADKAERETGLARGACDYLTKPFNLREVVNTIRRCLATPERPT